MHHTIALCEATRIVLIPGHTYTVEVVPECQTCDELAALAAESLCR